ncbi:MAG: D-alanine--poly(phosphoribitol) ligase, partial [Slackia isoflavoniconvertens]|nr:D-alanine--poly(phosphoribitol) ligase [Slackia isoflavoniconvertens]
MGECMVSNAFVESVETQAAIAPQAIAFEADSCCMTYGELSSASNAIAAKLREMTSDRFPVVVFGHKDFRMVASFLG